MMNKTEEIVSFLENICRQSNHPTAAFWRTYWFDSGHSKRLLHMFTVLDPILRKRPILLDVGSFGEFPLILRKIYELPVVYAASLQGDFLCYGKGQLLPRDDPAIEISLEIEQCDIECQKTSLQAGSVDVVTCFEVLEHLRTDPMFMMLEIHRVLRNYGLLVLSTPNASSWDSLFRIATYQSPFTFSSYFADGSGIGHCKEYSVSEIRLLLKNSGFVVEELQTFDTSTLQTIPRSFKRLMRAVPKDLRQQTFLVYARKVGQPKMRKYYPLYTEDVPYEDPQDLKASLC